MANQHDRANASVIDDTFRGLAGSVEFHRMGREDIVGDRPGDILVQAVREHAAAKGFARTESAPVEEVVERKSAGRVPVSGLVDPALDVAKDFGNSEATE